MKFLLKFKDLSESTSAFSQERAGWEFPPFKFAKNFDPRIGYSKDDFYVDICAIYKEANREKRDGIMLIAKNTADIRRLSEIKNLNNKVVNLLMKDIEEFLASKSESVLRVLPDGFVLCYENIKYKGRICDIYYSPTEKCVKISYSDVYPENEEYEISLNDFKPDVFGVKDEDFKFTIDKCAPLVKSSFII